MTRWWLGLFLLLWPAMAVQGQDAPAPAPPSDDSPVVALQKACAAGAIDQVVELLLNGAPVDGTVGDDHTTPLMIAAKANHMDVALYLISKGANFDLTDNAGNTALNLACQANAEDGAVALLKAGANVGLANQEGRLPLMSAAANGNTELVNALLASHADVNAVTQAGSAVWYATFNNKPKTVQALINAGADLNPKFPPPTDPANPRISVLGAAAAVGNIELLDLLLNNGAKVDGGGADGTTAVAVAAANNRIDIIQDLVRKYADLDRVNQAGETPLMLAATRGRLEAIECLYQNRAQLDLADQNGMTALMRACANGQDAVARFLISRGADVNAADPHGETALTYAGDLGDASLVKALLARGVRRTDVHIIARPMPQPPLTAAQNWALAVSALSSQVAGANPHLLGNGISASSATRILNRSWGVSNQTTFLPCLQELLQYGDRTAWQEAGARLNNPDANPPNRGMLPNSDGMLNLQALHDDYHEWHDLCGLAWDLCRAANLVNLGYAAGYLNEQDSWTQLLTIARQVQASFGSWAEMNANYLDGRSLVRRTEPRLNTCSQLLLDPQDPNSPWNQNPWKTSLDAPASH